ncbi:Nitrilase/cyanide hydratase and apolipo protein N-acyltransferase [Gongronella butleri]|nr:Nitrilase/cyanide hydratase and apolipo protein N-acyltransferase [Gongronella butleri]
MSMRVAAVQFFRDDKNQELNFTRAEQFLKQAAEQDVDLVVFPEYFLSLPWVPLADPVPRFSALAKQYGVDIVTGSYNIEEDGKRYNEAAYIDKDGTVLIKYRKNHLWLAERGHNTPGKGFPTAVNRFGIRVGLLICWDLAFADGFTEMALNQGAQLIVVPAWWSFDDAGTVGMGHDKNSEIHLVDSMCVSRAFEFEVAVVFANTAAAPRDEEVSCDRGSVEIGHSQMALPFKGCVARAAHQHEQLLIHDLPIATITKDAETSYEIRSDFDIKMGKKQKL